MTYETFVIIGEVVTILALVGALRAERRRHTRMRSAASRMATAYAMSTGSPSEAVAVRAFTNAGIGEQEARRLIGLPAKEN